MRALTIRQPCAYLVVVGDKPVENRTKPWPSTLELPCRIGIHAGKGDHDGCWDALNASLSAPSVDVVYGALIGFATVVGFHHADDCATWDQGYCDPSAMPGMWHYVLEDPEPLDEPIPMRGALGLWRLPSGTCLDCGQAHLTVGEALACDDQIYPGEPTEVTA